MNAIIEKRKQDWIDFYDINSPVNKLLVVWLTEHMAKGPLLCLENMKEREEWIYRKYMFQMENLERIPDHTIPHLDMLTGTQIFAEAFGCKVHLPQDSNPFAMPLIRDVSEFYKIKKPRWEDTNLTKLFDAGDRLRDRVGKDVLLSLPDIQSPMDIASMIWDKSDFYAAMFDEEHAVVELAQMIKEFLFEFLDEWFRRYGKECMAHFPDYYMPYGITLSEDEVGIVSAEMFRKYYADELKEFSERYGAIGIHCCADSKHQWENFKEIPNLKLLNLEYGRNMKEGLSYFRDSVAQYHCGFDVDQIADLPDSKNIHLANVAIVNTLEEGIEYAKRFNDMLQ